MNFQSVLKKGTGRFLVAMLTALMIGCGGNVSDTEHVQRAKRLQAEGDIRAASIELKNALQQNANNPEARYLLGKINNQIGNGAAAEKELLQAQGLGVAKEALLPELARAWLLQAEYDRVLEQIDPSAIKDHPDADRLYALLGEAYLGKQQLEKAGSYFDKAVELDSESLLGLLGQAKAVAVHGDAEKSLAITDRLVELYPGNARVWEYRGDLLRWSGEIEKAEQAYSEAVSNSEYRFNARLKRTLMRILLRDFGNAEKDVEVLNQYFPRLAGPHFARGLMAFFQEEYRDAQTAFQEAYSLDEKYYPAIYYLGATHLVLGNYEQAERFLHIYLNANGKSTSARMLLASLLYRTGEFAAAERILNAVLSQDPQNLPAMHLLGSVYISSGQGGKAAAIMRQALELDRDSAPIRSRLGLSLMLSGQSDEGVRLMEQAVEQVEGFQRVNVFLVFAYMLDGEYDQALDTLDRFEGQDPDNALLKSLRGTVLAEMGNREAAEKAFLEARELDPALVPPLLSLARLALMDDDREQAADYYNLILKHHKDHLGALLALAELSLNADPRQAEDYLEQAHSSHPESVRVNFGLARLHMQRNQFERAIEYVNAGLRQAPENPGLLELAGLAYVSTQQYGAAIGAFSDLVTLQPDVVQSRLYLAQAYRFNGDYNEAARQLKAIDDSASGTMGVLAERARLALAQRNYSKALQLADRLVQADYAAIGYELRGDILAARQDLAQAIENYTLAFEANPSGSLVQKRIRLLVADGHLEQALEVARSWLDAHPDDPAVLMYRGDIYSRLNDVAAAVASYREVLEYQPENILVLNNLAWALRDSEPEQALSYAETAWELSPNSAAVGDTYGMILLGLNRPNRAIQVLEHAVDQAPHSHIIRYHLALAYHQQKMTDRAIRTLETVLSGAPEDFEQREQATELLQQLRQ